MRKPESERWRFAHRRIGCRIAIERRAADWKVFRARSLSGFRSRRNRRAECGNRRVKDGASRIEGLDAVLRSKDALLIGRYFGRGAFPVSALRFPLSISFPVFKSGIGGHF